MSRLTKYEKETILLTNEGDDFWEVYTFNRPLKRRLKEFSRKYPEHCRLKEEDPKLGCVTYDIDKGRLSIRLNAPYSYDRKKIASIQAKKSGFGSENFDRNC